MELQIQVSRLEMYFITDVFADNDLTPEPKMNNIPYGIDKVSRIMEEVLPVLTLTRLSHTLNVNQEIN